MPGREVTVTIKAQDKFATVLAKYQREMDKSEAVTREVGKQSESTGKQMDIMGKAIAGAITFAAINKVAEMAHQTFELGIAADMTDERFDQLTRTFEDQEVLMQRLRDAAQGMATDFELQAASNKLLQSGLVGSGEELTKVVDLVSKLKQPTDDLSEALDNFGLTLLNRSLPRLDSFGISASSVRDRMNQLKQAGLDVDSAFKQAVFEEGESSIGRLGTAADKSGTSVGRLAADLENAANNAAILFASDVESLALTVEMLVEIPELQRQHAIMQAETLAGDMTIAMSNMGDVDTEGSDPVFVQEFLERAIQTARENPDLLNDVEALRDDVLAQFGISEEGMIGASLIAPGAADELAALAQQTVIERDKAIEIADAQERSAAALNRAKETVSRLNQQMSGVTESARQFLKPMELAQMETDAITAAFENVSGFGV